MLKKIKVVREGRGFNTRRKIFFIENKINILERGHGSIELFYEVIKKLMHDFLKLLVSDGSYITGQLVKQERERKKHSEQY